MRIHKRKARYKDGDYLMECDYTGRVDYRSNMRKTWNNLWIHKDYFETRNQQDFIRVQPEKQAVEEARPRREATYTTVTPDDL